MNKWQNKGTPWERLPKEVKIILALMLGFVLIFPPKLSTETHIEVCDEEIYDVTIIRPDVNIRRDTVTYSNRILASLKEEVKIPKLVKKLVNIDKIEKKLSVETKKVVKGESYSDYQIIMWLLKSSEGLHLEAYWDYAQWTSGWGTKSKEGEIISKKEADRRCKEAYQKRFKKITKAYPHLPKWDRMILTVMRYNVGSFGKNLTKAIHTGDRKKIAKNMIKYKYSSTGVYLRGLEKRRNLEAKLLQATPSEKQEIGHSLKRKVIKKINKSKKR